MKSILFIATLLLTAGVNAAPACPALLNFSLTDIDGKTRSLCTYAGKVVLVVNTASQCGYTGQYKGLQALSDQYGPRGLVVLGLPANDFAGQEPGSNATIKSFCEVGYQVNFPLFSKTGVTASSTSKSYLSKYRPPCYTFKKTMKHVRRILLYKRCIFKAY